MPCPGVARDSVHNLLANISSPVVFSNDVLQAKPQRAGTTMMRFLINSTAGLGGLFDVANKARLSRRTTPISASPWRFGASAQGRSCSCRCSGPSNPRDAAGFGADIALDPLTYASFGG